MRIARPGAAVLAVVLAAIGVPVTVGAVRAEAQPPAPMPAAGTPPAVPLGADPAPRKQIRPRAVPMRLAIPAIGVGTELMSLGLNADGTVEVPPLTAGAPAGWYRDSAAPGETGAAVILGHVDSARDGPAVFDRLGDLKPGDRITVDAAGGRVARFAVTEVRSFAKTAFPTGLVYGPTPEATLRLVTCGGSFDRRRGSYRDNVVVFARAL